MPSRAVVARARKIRLLVMDVDGVLTDGRMILSDRGEELKSFHTHDGIGLALAKRQQRIAEIVLRRRPVHRIMLAG